MAEVYFANLHANVKRNVLDKLGILLEKFDMGQMFQKDDMVAIKIHFGEKGNLAYIRPNFVRVVVDALKKHEAKPFVTDCNTLYRGTRAESVSHITTAIENGFDYAVIRAPIIIGDGITGKSFCKVDVNLEHCKKVSIGAEIVRAHGIVVMSHFKGHELAGFGGTLKNLGMGCASREGKLTQHSSLAPTVDKDTCVGCGFCAKWCSHGAITMVSKKAEISSKNCVGCAECILVCPKGAIGINCNVEVPVMQKIMVEHAYGALKGKEKKMLFLNFLTQISPACDCYGHNDIPITGDIGIVASLDPVAIDQASVDLVNKEPGYKGSRLKSGFAPGEDKFRGVYPSIDWTAQLDYAEKIGMGSRKYKLVPID